MDADLRDLLAEWTEGDEPLDDARRELLLARLGQDAAFRRAFVDEIHMLGMLRAVQAPEPRWLRLEDELGWSARPKIEKEPLADRVLRQAQQRPTSRGARGLQASRWLPVLTALVAAAACLLAFVRLVGKPETGSKWSASRPPELARIVAAEGATWEENTSLHEGSGVAVGALRLRSGEITLSFISGAMFTVEGPADLDVLAAERVLCTRGRLRVRVPPGAEGFTVAGPGYEVVDLGTDFGMNVEPSEATRLMVFEGQVAVTILDSDGRTVQSALLEAGSAVEVAAQTPRIREAAPRPEYFLHAPSPRPTTFRLGPDYRGEVIASRPWGYWRFESLAGGRVANEIAGRPALAVHGGVRLDAVPGGSSCAWFQPGDQDQCFLMDGEWSPSRGKGYAIELWVQGESLGQSALVGLIAGMDGPEEQHVSLLELTARNRSAAGAPCAVRFLDRWPPGITGGVNVFSRRTHVPDRWHHVVGQRAGESLELYIDGILMGTSRSDQTAATTPCRLLVGRLKQAPLKPTTEQIRPFEGRIAELALYDHALTPEEIRRHCQHAAGDAQ